MYFRPRGNWEFENFLVKRWLKSKKKRQKLRICVEFELIKFKEL